MISVGRSTSFMNPQRGDIEVAIGECGAHAPRLSAVTGPVLAHTHSPQRAHECAAEVQSSLCPSIVQLRAPAVQQSNAGQAR
jgi:hypothetical protein